MDAPSATVEGIVRWCGTTAGSLDLRTGVLDRLTALIPFDTAFFATVDPATLLYTSAVRQHMPAEASPAFLRTEFGAHDVNQLRDLARAPSPVGWLDDATQGDRARSARYREAMAPIGLGDELRVALRVDGECWGLLCLHRADAIAGFSARDADVLGRLAPHLAAAVRRATVTRDATSDLTADGPGVAVLASDGTVEATTPSAARWLDELRALDTPRLRPLPAVVESVVHHLHALHRSGASDAVMPRARLRAPSGRWLVVHASALDGDVPGRVAVVIEPAAPAVLASLIVAAYQFTPRETEVVQFLLGGRARKEIAAALQISRHTVNDYVKAIFDKTGVSTVGQLRAELMR